MWQLLYSRKKLSRCDRKELQETLDQWGSQLQDLYSLYSIDVREMSCSEPIEVCNIITASFVLSFKLIVTL